MTLATRNQHLNKYGQGERNMKQMKQILKVSESYPIRRFRGLSKGARKIHMRLLGVPNWEDDWE